MKQLFALLIGAMLFMGFAPSTTGYHVGDAAKDFHLKNVDGKIVSLSDYTKAKGFIVTFTCNHCPFAKMYEERIMALDKQFAPKGYPVIAISSNDASEITDDSYPKMIERAKKKGYTFPYLYDEKQDVAHAFGATNTPHVFVVAKEHGKYVVKYIGAIDDSPREAAEAKKHYVADAVKALLSHKKVAVTETKAIGCSIKWFEED